MTTLEKSATASVPAPRRSLRTGVAPTALVALVALVALLAAPAVARADEPAAPRAVPDDTVGTPCPRRGEPPPPGYRCAMPRAFRTLMIAGGVISGLGYTVNVLTMAGNGGADPVAAVPVFGSFIATATHRTPPPPPCGMDQWFCGGLLSEDFSVPSYLVSGALQAIGAVVMLTGLAVRKPELVRERRFSVTPVPFAGPQGSGLRLVGTF